MGSKECGMCVCVCVCTRRRKTTAEKKEEAARKAARAQAEEPLDPAAPFTLAQKQPWANKEVKVSV